MQRQFDPTPAPSETLQEYIDRMICGKVSGRLWWVWGWPPPRWDAFSQRLCTRNHLNHTVQGS